jgi:hypothetical protein
VLLIAMRSKESSIIKLVEDAIARILVFGVGVEVDDIDDSLWIFDLFFS